MTSKKPELRRMLLDSSPRVVMRATKNALGFEFREGVFVADPWIRFMPKGLIIWGAPNHSVLDQCLITNMNCVVASHVGIPCEWFSHWKSYAQFAEAMEAGIEPAGWCTYESIVPGQQIRITIRSSDGRTLGPADDIRLAMWGIGYV